MKKRRGKRSRGGRSRGGRSRGGSSRGGRIRSASRRKKARKIRKKLKNRQIGGRGFPRPGRQPRKPIGGLRGLRPGKHRQPKYFDPSEDSKPCIGKHTRRCLRRRRKRRQLRKQMGLKRGEAGSCVVGTGAPSPLSLAKCQRKCVACGRACRCLMNGQDIKTGETVEEAEHPEPHESHEAEHPEPHESHDTDSTSDSSMIPDGYGVPSDSNGDETLAPTDAWGSENFGDENLGGVDGDFSAGGYGNNNGGGYGHDNAGGYGVYRRI